MKLVFRYTKIKEYKKHYGRGVYMKHVNSKVRRKMGKFQLTDKMDGADNSNFLFLVTTTKLELINGFPIT